DCGTPGMQCAGSPRSIESIARHYDDEPAIARGRYLATDRTARAARCCVAGVAGACARRPRPHSRITVCKGVMSGPGTPPVASPQVRRMIALVVLAAACGSPPHAAPPDAAPGDDAGSPPDAPGGPSADPLAALAAMPAQCSADHWCWRDPRPTGNDYD